MLINRVISTIIRDLFVARDSFLDFRARQMKRYINTQSKENEIGRDLSGH